MNRITLASALLLGSILWWHPLLPVAAVLWALAALSLLAVPPEDAEREWLHPVPLRRRQRGWVWAWGLGVSHWGPFPFLVIRRRYR